MQYLITSLLADTAFLALHNSTGTAQDVGPDFSQRERTKFNRFVDLRIYESIGIEFFFDIRYEKLKLPDLTSIIKTNVRFVDPNLLF